MLQVIEMLWNLFDLAAETANQVAAGSSGHPAQHQAHMQEQQEQQDQQAQASGAGALQDEPSQEQALQPLQQDALSAASPVAQQLVDVLAVALQQQVATCSSLQVGHWIPTLTAQYGVVHALSLSPAADPPVAHKLVACLCLPCCGDLLIMRYTTAHMHVFNLQRLVAYSAALLKMEVGANR
jgi:hypothetical protein